MQGIDPGNLGPDSCTGLVRWDANSFHAIDLPSTGGRIAGNICSDGSFHFVTNVPDDLGGDSRELLNQFTIYGQL